MKSASRTSRLLHENASRSISRNSAVPKTHFLKALSNATVQFYTCPNDSYFHARNTRPCLMYEPRRSTFLDTRQRSESAWATVHEEKSMWGNQKKPERRKSRTGPKNFSTNQRRSPLRRLGRERTLMSTDAMRPLGATADRSNRSSYRRSPFIWRLGPKPCVDGRRRTQWSHRICAHSVRSLPSRRSGLRRLIR